MCVLVLNIPLVFSQDTQGSSSDSVAGDFSLHTIRGCLMQSGTQYTLTVGGVSPRQYRLIGSNLAQLDGKAGHVVSITGTLPQSSQAGTGARVVTTGSEVINFLAVEDVAPTCTASSDGGTAPQTPYSRAFESVILEPGPLAESSSYMIIPLVGVLALCLLQVAHYQRK